MGLYKPFCCNINKEAALLWDLQRFQDCGCEILKTLRDKFPPVSCTTWGNGIWETEGQTGEKPAHKAPLMQQLLWMNVKAAAPRNGEEKRGDPSIRNQLPIAISFPSLRYGVGRRVFCFALLFLSPPRLDWRVASDLPQVDSHSLFYYLLRLM